MLLPAPPPLQRPLIVASLVAFAGSTPYLSNFATKLLQTLNVSASLLVPCAICHYTQANPVVCGPLVFGATVLFLKLVSYGHTNAVLRERWMSMPPRDGKDAAIPFSYPNNLSLYDITRFLAFPTLCYQTSYPRTSKIRKKVRRRRCHDAVTTLSRRCHVAAANTAASLTRRSGSLSAPPSCS